MTRNCTQLLNQSNSVDWACFHRFQLYTNFLSHVAASFVHAEHFLPRFNLVVYWVESMTILKALNSMGQLARLEEQK